ncbi:unnamed protein product [Rotaria sp. Silwood1]|nr:unnamed protein product [Rotaria sp. Silwood1]CAF0955820.1 unnamed protein product [Rotaria sp. Silwood1]CAF3402801.1 unnamed protein product [Rotaria sp. Silwood1]CAF4929679.1 unnamed protein product [Rotaria sp. Silwood1]
MDYIQENSLSPYQTFSSSNMTIELCFRLCRQWIILINKNHTNCICLYTMTKPNEFNEFLGEFVTINNCTSNNLQIYSLTKDFDLLPSISLSNYDWSLDGCYYLHGIQTYRANLLLIDIDYNQGIDTCRKHCQIKRQTNYFSFFLSLRKSCYCLPIEVSQPIIPKAVRKPLIHCSFLSYLKSGFENSLNQSEINLDTVVKINVQRYCSPAFIFDRKLHLCLKLIPLSILNSYTKINTNENCLPILIKTYEQWNHLISKTLTLRTLTYIKIDYNSTYIFDDLFKSKYRSLPSNDLCVVIIQTNANRSLSYELLPCSTARSPGSILCSQKTLETTMSDQTEFKMINTQERSSMIYNYSCPSEFVLFNNKCYYVHISFVFNILHGERLCSNKYSNSTLVKFNFHEWDNVNTSRFLGRSFDDVRLEFFYYELETRLLSESKNDTNTKHWLRLLLGDKTNHNDCVLRYFIRSSGAFTAFHRCNHGGHPVCQCEPIRNNMLKIILINETQNNISQIKNDSLETNIKIESSTIDLTLPVLSNSTNLSITSDETIIPICDNCTNIIADEDLLNNETNIDYKSNSSNILTTTKPQRSNYRRLVMIVTGSLITFIIFITGIVFLIRYIRQTCGSYSIRNGTRDPSRGKQRRSTGTIPNDVSNRPTVVYSRLKSRPPSTTMDVDMMHAFNISSGNDDTVQLLPQPINPTTLNENIITKDDEESLYAKIQPSNEK